jgi:GxxExxY protein
MKENEISYNIRGAAFTVHNELGPGLLESVYETALAFELEIAN